MAEAIHKITTGGQEYIHEASLVLAEAFEKDYATLYQLGTLSHEQYMTYLPKHFELTLTAVVAGGGSIDEIDGWRSVGIFLPPGGKIEISRRALETNFLNAIGMVEPESCQRILTELPTIENECRLKGMPGYPDIDHYYLSLVGTKNDSRGRGLCSAMIRHYQAIAVEKRLPIWLEAGDKHSLKLYVSLGFTIVDNMILGKGEVGFDGKPKKDGEGITLTGCIWNPK